MGRERRGKQSEGGGRKDGLTGEGDRGRREDEVEEGRLAKVQSNIFSHNQMAWRSVFLSRG